MQLQLKSKLGDLREADASFLQEARERGRALKVGQTAFIKNSDYSSEVAYKRVMAKKGQIMYHYHLCCLDHADFRRQMADFEQLLPEHGVHLDRFGISIDPAMALPREIRDKNRKGGALFFQTQADWDMLGISPIMQPHLGDNMIGSPACYETAACALQAGVTTMGNVSQFFGYEYPEFTDVDARVRSTLQAMALMAETRDKGALIHSNLDDGYGDMFFSPMKRLIMLSALKQLHGKDIVGSMVFTNKLGRNHKDISLNVPHLSMSLIYDMAGQYVYQTGHAVTTMANQGLTTDTTVEDVVKTLEYAKELEAYLPAVVDTIDFDKIDREAAKVCKRGEMFFEATLEALSQVIDVRNPYALLSALKRVGIKNLTAAFGKDDSDVIVTDYNLFSHEY